MEPSERRAPARAAGAALAFALAALSYLPAARLLHYVSFSGDVDAARLAWLVPLASIGIVIGLSAAAMGSMYAQIRIFFVMAKDGLLPPLFAIVHPRHRTPQWGTIVVGFACTLIAGVLPLEVLGELVSIGTLLAFAIVCLCVLVLRYRATTRPRPFRVPIVWLVSPSGILVCVYMMCSLPLDTWLRLIVWMLLGLTIYFGYGRRSARTTAPTAETRLSQ